jgi:hypothetical protein
MDGFAARVIESTYAIMMRAFLRMQRAAIQMFSKHRGKEKVLCDVGEPMEKC